MTRPAKDPLHAELEAHRRICLELFDLFQEENAALHDAPPPGAFNRFQEQRRRLLAQLSASQDRIHTLAGPVQDPAVQSTLRASLDIIVRAVRLDRENEGLMLQQGLMTPGSLPSAASRNLSMIRDAYQFAAAPTPPKAPARFVPPPARP